MSASKRGKLIVFEGLDRAGKTTQCAKLVENLRFQGRSVKALRFPDRSTPIGTMIANYLTGSGHQEDHVIHLLFSANRWELAESIETALQAGTDVVIDRYHYSGCVYSAAKNNPTLGLDWARKPDEGLPRADICIFLAISAENAAKRGGYGQERYERQDLQERVRKLYQVLQDSPDGADIVEIDGGGSFEAVEQAVLDAVTACCHEVDEGHLPLRHVEPW